MNKQTIKAVQSIDNLSTVNLGLIYGAEVKLAEAIRASAEDVKSAGIKPADLPERYSMNNLYCKAIHDGLLSKFSKRDIATFTKGKKKGAKDADELYFKSVDRKLRRYYSAIRVNLNTLFGISIGVQTTSRVSQAGKLKLESTARAVISLLACKDKLSVDEPTQQEVAICAFIQKAIDSIIAETGTADMRKAKSEYEAGKFKVNLSIAKK